MKQALTILLLGISITSGWAQSLPTDPWQPRPDVRRRLHGRAIRLYAGFELGGAYRNQIRYQDSGDRLGQRYWMTPELVPGLVLGYQRRRWVAELGLYNLPSTISYSVVVGPSEQQGLGIGLQYAQIPIRVKRLFFRPDRRLNVNGQLGLALAWNGALRRGQFDRLSTAVLGTDTLGLSDESIMLNRLSPLLEGGAEVTYRLNRYFTLSGYVRQLIGLQTLWRKDIRYQVNSELPVRQARASTRATGTTFGVGVKYHFALGTRYRYREEAAGLGW
jgi:hypothetical protein